MIFLFFLKQSYVPFGISWFSLSGTAVFGSGSFGFDVEADVVLTAGGVVVVDVVVDVVVVLGDVGDDVGFVVVLAVEVDVVVFDTGGSAMDGDFPSQGLEATENRDNDKWQHLAEYCLG